MDQSYLNKDSSTEVSKAQDQTGRNIYLPVVGSQHHHVPSPASGIWAPDTQATHQHASADNPRFIFLPSDEVNWAYTSHSSMQFSLNPFTNPPTFPAYPELHSRWWPSLSYL
jgi:hypothetical protein